ncbi:hypothetical protein GGX14DRAFT_658708 [Mycena pura]|uniref:Uncharacterized protein n=1 Tax=Mycena pura TaxID=153505 RepID=A0AAD6V4Y5_9AGAR|nr:hypothetical protein GGX14DRAFT_658708 [Mycena pura]
MPSSSGTSVTTGEQHSGARRTSAACTAREARDVKAGARRTGQARRGGHLERKEPLALRVLGPGPGVAEAAYSSRVWTPLVPRRHALHALSRCCTRRSAGVEQRKATYAPGVDGDFVWTLQRREREEAPVRKRRASCGTCSKALCALRLPWQWWGPAAGGLSGACGRGGCVRRGEGGGSALRELIALDTKASLEFPGDLSAWEYTVVVVRAHGVTPRGHRRAGEAVHVSGGGEGVAQVLEVVERRRAVNPCSEAAEGIAAGHACSAHLVQRGSGRDRHSACLQRIRAARVRGAPQVQTVGCAQRARGRRAEGGVTQGVANEPHTHSVEPAWAVDHELGVKKPRTKRLIRVVASIDDDEREKTEKTKNKNKCVRKKGHLPTSYALPASRAFVVRERRPAVSAAAGLRRTRARGHPHRTSAATWLGPDGRAAGVHRRRRVECGGELRAGAGAATSPQKQRHSPPSSACGPHVRGFRRTFEQQRNSQAVRRRRQANEVGGGQRQRVGRDGGWRRAQGWGECKRVRAWGRASSIVQPRVRARCHKCGVRQVRARGGKCEPRAASAAMRRRVRVLRAGTGGTRGRLRPHTRTHEEARCGECRRGAARDGAGRQVRESVAPHALGIEQYTLLDKQDAQNLLDLVPIQVDLLVVDGHDVGSESRA